MCSIQCVGYCVECIVYSELGTVLNGMYNAYNVLGTVLNV